MRRNEREEQAENSKMLCAIERARFVQRIAQKCVTGTPPQGTDS
jgi:hypothetical protein